MKSLSEQSQFPEPRPLEPFNGPSRDRRAAAYSNAGATLHALGGPAAILEVAEDEDDAWDPSVDEDTGGFDIHLGVYASD
jgi:hypothetical protein